MKRFFGIASAVFILAFTLAACGGGTSNSSSTTVTTSASDFNQHSITINKGQALTITNDASSASGSEHIFVMGTNGQATSQAGAPDLGNGLTAQPGASVTTPAFANAGTYTMTCTIHPNMLLTITVK